LDNITVTTNKQIINLKLKIIKTLKLKQNKILKLNKQTYLPFLIHQLPTNYNKFNTLNIIKINTTIYINSIEFTKKYINTYLNTLNYSNINKNCIK